MRSRRTGLSLILGLISVGCSGGTPSDGGEPAAAPPPTGGGSQQVPGATPDTVPRAPIRRTPISISAPAVRKPGTAPTRGAPSSSQGGVGKALQINPYGVQELAAGWTRFVPSHDTRLVFVSSSRGSDANTGRSPQSPKASLAAGIAMLRDGYPDWLLLRRCDVWTERLNRFSKNGRGPRAKLVIGTYGGGRRARIHSGTSTALSVLSGISHVAFVGLELTPERYDGRSGRPVVVNLRGTSDDVLFEDVYIHNAFLGMQIRGDSVSRPSTNIAIRRTIIARTYTAGSSGHPSGIYAQEVDGCLLEGCVFYRSGHDPDVPGSVATMFRHATYFHNESANVTARGNIVAETSSTGIQLRGRESIIEDNLVLRTPIAIQFGGGHQPYATPGGATGVVLDNVIMDGTDISSSLPRRWGIAAKNVGSGRIANNIIAHDDAPHVWGYPLRIDPGDSSDGIGVNNLLIERNIVYEWSGFSWWNSFTAAFQNNVLRGNHFQYASRLATDQYSTIMQIGAAHAAGLTSSSNSFFSADSNTTWFQIDGRPTTLAEWKQLFGDRSSARERIRYADPDRTVATYVDFVERRRSGSSSYRHFINRVLGQSVFNWSAAYTAPAVNNYVRAGFGR